MKLGVTELALIALIVFFLFGTRKLKNIGGDLGSAIRDFKQSIHENVEIQSDKNTDTKINDLDVRNSESIDPLRK
jgi:sec-independent protein translocase protein TatA